MNTLNNYVSRIEDVIQCIGNDTIKEQFESIRCRIAERNYKIAVVGEYSSGKSTFINALIGKDILKHASRETTASITYIHNVKKGDNKENTVSVHFKNGVEKQLNNFDELGRYTTANSDINVVNDILYTDVYVNFLDTGHIVTVVDTPGLNGVAEGHRAITYSEIRKSHACIYLLPLGGIKNSDIEFIRHLSKYQRTVIFVQNFIDDLKQSEGETVEGKLEKDNKILQSSLSDIDFNKYLCGISALMALAARDKGIKQLYDDSISGITDEERLKLWDRSGFGNFLDLLRSIITGNEFEKMRDTDNCIALLNFAEDLLSILDRRQDSMKKMREEDGAAEDIDQMKKRRDEIKASFDGRLQKLNNYISSCFGEDRRELKESAERSIREIVKDLEANVDARLYDDLEILIDSNGLRNIISSKIVDFNERFNREKRIYAEWIYKTVLERMDEFVTAESEPEPIVFSYSMVKTDADFSSLSSDKKQIDDLKSQASGDKAELDKFEEQRRLECASNPDWDRKIKETENKRNIAEMERNQKVRALGSKPAVGERPVRRKRGGFLGSILDFFDGGVKETVYDDSEQKKWIKNKKNIEKEYEAERAQLNSDIERLKNKKNEHEQTLLSLDSEIKRAERHWKDKIEAINQKQRELELKEKNLKHEYTRKIKRTLKEDINRYFDGFLNNVKRSIEDDTSKNAEIVKKYTEEEYRKRTEIRLKALSEAIENEECELDKIYIDYADVISKVNTIIDELKESVTIE